MASHSAIANDRLPAGEVSAETGISGVDTAGQRRRLSSRFHSCSAAAGAIPRTIDRGDRGLRTVNARLALLEASGRALL